MLEILFFLLMLLLAGIPFMPGLVELLRPRDDTPLPIDLDKSSDPRHQALQLAEELPCNCSGEIAKGSKFKSPLHSTDNVVVEERCEIDSLCSARSIILKTGVVIRHLVDAEEALTVEKGCSLGAIASSAGTICLAPKCTFKRLYAPKIVCLEDPSAESGIEAYPPLSPIDIGHFGWYVNRTKFIIPPESVIKQNVYAEQDLRIRHKAVIEGSIQCGGKVYLGDSVTVKGNIFAKETIVIGRQCQILGNIFSQSSVIINTGSVIGEMGKIKSVIGKDKVKLHTGITVYGHVMTQGKGYVI